MVKELKNVKLGDIIEIEYEDAIKKNKFGKYVGYVYKKEDFVVKLSDGNPKKFGTEHAIINTYNLERIKSYKILKKG